MCDDLELGEVREIAPGVRVARRSFIATFAAVLATASSAAVRAQAAEIAQAKLTFAEFLAVANPLARELVTDTSLTGQDRYLLSLAAVATRLADVPVPELNDSRQGETKGTFIGSNPGGEPFTVLHWRLEPGARVRPHAHTYGMVVTLGLDGEALVENFEVLGARDFEAKTPLRVIRTRAQRLTRGGVNLVSLERDYIHGFTAGPNGARGLDITTRIKPRTPTPYLIIPASAVRDRPFEAALSIDDPMTA
jgi:hypothetical protein